MADTLDILRSAVAAAPDNGALRAELARLLVAGGHAKEALEHAMLVLAAVPDHGAALDVAERACAALGDSARAASYRRLREVVTSEPTPGVATPPPPVIDKVTHANSIDGGAVIIPIHAARSGGESFIEAPAEAVKLSDVAGMTRAKSRVEAAFLAPLANPELRRAFNKSLRGGLLLYGPPGCGKTYLARALSGELGARFYSTGLHEILDMFVGSSEKNLHGVFETARRNAPAVLFFDEIDALGQKRTALAGSGHRQVVVQFLSEFDSVTVDNRGVFVLAATNHPWDVDTALRRPGRFDRMIFVLPPDVEARAVILRLHLKDRPLADGIEVDSIARRAHLYSGADLAHICETAAEMALLESAKLGSISPITQWHLERAAAEVQPSCVTWLATARNYAKFANDGGVFDELLAYLRAEKLA